jgi:L-alanine-DL-glutamate epimerase-like enolase superfamily enzyme
MVRGGRVVVQRVRARSFTVPTDAPEEDGTLSWESTTLVLAEIRVGKEVGIGFTYSTPACAAVVADVLAEVVVGSDPLSPTAVWQRMRAAVRNVGYPGIAASAISAVDVALWDLKAKLLGVSLATLLGRVHESVPVYGSGGFTSYSEGQLQRQLAQWVQEGIPRVKMKVGADPPRDLERVCLAREAIGEEAELFVDANGAYECKQALELAHAFAEHAGVSWFEEPVSSDDLEGLALLRERAPAPMRVAAGEYGYDCFYFRRMLEAGAVDVLQADVTRCGGITELLNVGGLCAAHSIPLSAHTSPAIHAHACAAIAPLLHVEYFHDHARIEALMFDGVLQPVHGALCPDEGRPGLGLALREADAAPYER